ncbi:MAG: hypothetical protein M3137_10825, partial [Actinomycetota bacterium]|nr:hypothetical protein [Actinomycetota bacterium]
MIISGDVLVRVERTAALAEAAIAATLPPLDQQWRASAFSVAGGQVVLLGPGMYVNRGMALGLRRETTTEVRSCASSAKMTGRPRSPMSWTGTPS